MKPFHCIAAGVIAPLLVLNPLWAGDAPRQVFQKWVEMVNQKDLEKILTVSSSQLRSTVPQTPEERKSLVNILYDQRPQGYQVLDEKISADGNTATLVVEAMQNPALVLKGEKVVPKKEKGKIRFIKEGGEWKVNGQEWGMN